MGPAGQTGFLPAAWGTVGPVCSSPRVVIWGALTLILRKVNYLSIMRPKNSDRGLRCYMPSSLVGDRQQRVGEDDREQKFAVPVYLSPSQGSHTRLAVSMLLR